MTLKIVDYTNIDNSIRFDHRPPFEITGPIDLLLKPLHIRFGNVTNK